MKWTVYFFEMRRICLSNPAEIAVFDTKRKDSPTSAKVTMEALRLSAESLTCLQ
jgi:hypothetical protein